MDDPNITMEEYIRLHEEKAQRAGRTFNWQTATYVFVNDLKTDSENDNDKVNMPLFSTPEPEVSYSNDLDFFKDFENEFPAIVYNDALTSKSDFLTEPTESPQQSIELIWKMKHLVRMLREEPKNILYFNDLFPFNVIYHDDLKSDKDNDIDEIDIEQSSGDMSVVPLPNVINTDDGAYALRSNKLLETMLAGRQPRIYLSVIESVFPDCLYGVSKPHGYGVLTFWTLSSLYFQQSLYDDLLNETTSIYKSGNLEGLES
ncbi:hypothetical protein Tco_1415855 [Tanacetum coccineum]